MVISFVTFAALGLQPIFKKPGLIENSIKQEMDHFHVHRFWVISIDYIDFFNYN